MRKIKTLTLLALMLGSIVTAQEKQNDATWEETVDFIKENLQYAVADPEYFEKKVKYTIIDNKELEYKVLEVSSDDCFWKSTNNIPLNKIEKASYIDYTKDSYYKENNIYCALKIKTSEEYIKYSNCKKTRFGKEINLLFSSVQLTKCMVKAFNHLAFLAKEKRKESKF